MRLCVRVGSRKCLPIFQLQIILNIFNLIALFYSHFPFVSSINFLHDSNQDFELTIVAFLKTFSIILHQLFWPM